MKDTERRTGEETDKKTAENQGENTEREPMKEAEKEHGNSYACQEVNVRPFAYAISLVEGKWKMHILFWLWKKEVLRYSELKRALGKVTHKMLSSQLKELENSGMIERKEYPQVPPKVEYRLSEKGKSVMPILSAFCKWGCEHVPDDWQMQ